MCGIAGFVGQGDRATLGSMTEILRHRGPDGSGTWFAQADDNGLRVGLGHRRLSVIDLSDAGRQPMCTADGRYQIVYNGEIYNFAALREQLEHAGCKFKSKTDTEVLLYGYAVWGEKVLERVNGMFACAIWDTRRRELFLARDRLGVKPLYYTMCGDTLVFASEIKAILQYPGVERAVNPLSLHQYLSFLWVPDPDTIFKGIYRLAPGHLALYYNKRLSVREWWDCASAVSTPEDRCLPLHLERVRGAIRQAVERRLVADVPLGAFLSGGIDSSTIVAMMALRGRCPSTYAVGFTEEDLRYEIVDDDLRYARAMAAYSHADHHEIVLQPEVIETLPKVVWHMDEPVADPAAISAYLICQAARRTLTVMLSGQGGDEVFAGYPRHLAVRYARLYNLLPAALRESVIPRLIAPLHAADAGRWSTKVRNLKKFTRSAGLPFHDRYIGYLTHFSHAEKLGLYTDRLREELEEVDAAAAFRAHMARPASADPVNRMCYLDLKTFLPSLNLMYTDKMSMAHSVEVRVPFLDHELVCAALQIPGNFKLRGTTSKYILKRSMAGLLPQSILRRQKAGFTAPIRAWLRCQLRPLVDEFLRPEEIERRGLFRPEAVQELVAQHRSGCEDNAWKIYQLLTLELWMRTFLDSDGTRPVEVELAENAGVGQRGYKRRKREAVGEDRVSRAALQRGAKRRWRPALSRRQLWDKTPRLVRRAVGPVVRIVPASVLYGWRFRKLYDELREIERWPAERARRHQLEQLRKICRIATGTPFYREVFREAGFDWRDLERVEDLAGLPTIDADVVRARLSDMCAASPAARGVEYVSTGGSHGRPLHFYINSDRSPVEYAYLTASWRRGGYELGMTQAVFRGDVIPPNAAGLHHEYDPVLRRHNFSTFHMTDDDLLRYLQHIATIGPCYLLVYPSSVSTIAHFIERSGVTLPRNIRGVLAGSENVYRESRSMVERVLGVRYFAWYGHTEKLVMAAECEYSSDYHVWPTYGYFELLDGEGRPVATPGQRGEIVGTGFINTVVPFIRYRTGDYAAYVAPCCAACGREHTLIRDIRGHRVHEMLVAASGSMVPWTALNMHDRTFQHVSRFQFRQTVAGKVTLRLVPATGFDEACRKRIVRSLSSKLDGQIEVAVELVDDISLSPRGKTIYVDQQIDWAKRVSDRMVTA